jgi:hypothetical protein
VLQIQPRRCVSFTAIVAGALMAASAAAAVGLRDAKGTGEQGDLVLEMTPK